MQKIIITKDGKDHIISKTKKGDTIFRQFAHSPEYIKKITLQMANTTLKEKIKDLRAIYQSEEEINKKYNIPINVSSFFMIGSLPFLVTIFPLSAVTFTGSLIALVTIYKTYTKEIKNNLELQKQIDYLEEIIEHNNNTMPNGYEVIKDEQLQAAKVNYQNQPESAITIIDEEEINKLTEDYLEAYKIYKANKQIIQMTYNHSLESLTIFLQELGLNTNQITIIFNLVTENKESYLTSITEEYINYPKKKTLKKLNKKVK